MTSNRDNSFCNSGEAIPPGGGKRSRFPLQNHQFTPEELKALKECNDESFYQRCLPMSTMFGVGAYFGVQNGYLKGSPRFGPTPKVIVGMVLGYILGKFSYRQKCMDKFMALPNSQIGTMLREKKFPYSGMRSPEMFGAGPGDVYSDAGPGSSLDLNTDRPNYAGLPDYDPDAIPNPNDLQKDAQKSTATYEELRKKNRQDNLSTQSQPYRIEPAQPQPQITRPSRSDPQQKNRYGDVVE